MFHQFSSFSLTKTYQQRVKLFKGKYQGIQLQVGYISQEGVSVSQIRVIITFLHGWHLDPTAQRYLFTRSWNCECNSSDFSAPDETVKHFILLSSELPGNDTDDWATILLTPEDTEISTFLLISLFFACTCLSWSPLGPLLCVTKLQCCSKSRIKSR